MKSFLLIRNHNVELVNVDHVANWCTIGIQETCFMAWRHWPNTLGCELSVKVHKPQYTKFAIYFVSYSYYLSIFTIAMLYKWLWATHIGDMLVSHLPLSSDISRWQMIDHLYSNGRKLTSFANSPCALVIELLLY